MARRENYSFLRSQREALQIRRITDWNEDAFSAFLLNAGAYERGSTAAAAFGAYLSDRPVGAVELLTEDGYLDLISIVVKSERQRAGIGTALLDRAKEFSAEMDMDQISADIVSDSEDGEATAAFFRANGFYVSDAAGPVLTLCPAEMLELDLFQRMSPRNLPKNVIPAEELPAALQKRMEHLSSRRIRTAGHADEDVPGPCDLSLACVDNDKLEAFLLIEDRGGRLCLSSAYTDEAHISQFLYMLYSVLKKAARRGIRELHVSMGDSAFAEILTKITEEKPELLRRREIQRMVWTLEDAQMDLEAADRTLAETAGSAAGGEMSILVPKLMQLMEILEINEIPCDLMLGTVPYLMIDGRIAAQYILNDNTYEHFTLLFSSRIARGLSEEELRSRCEAVNMISRYVTAVPDEGDLLLRFAALEARVPIEEMVFLDYVRVFQTELSRAVMYTTEGM